MVNSGIPSPGNEAGGDQGKSALARLKNIIGRIESPWRPASPDESCEIVRRRLFQPIIDNERFIQRDAVARAFSQLYSAQHLTRLEGAQIEVSLEIQAYIPQGAPDEVVRTITENLKTLEITGCSFEKAAGRLPLDPQTHARSIAFHSRKRMSILFLTPLSTFLNKVCSLFSGLHAYIFENNPSKVFDIAISLHELHRSMSTPDRQSPCPYA
jgi:hypothetical protein